MFTAQQQRRCNYRPYSAQKTAQIYPPPTAHRHRPSPTCDHNNNISIPVVNQVLYVHDTVCMVPGTCTNTDRCSVSLRTTQQQLAAAVTHSRSFSRLCVPVVCCTCSICTRYLVCSNSMTTTTYEQEISLIARDLLCWMYSQVPDILFICNNTRLVSNTYTIIRGLLLLYVGTSERTS